MRKILVLLSLGLVALTGCKKDSSSLEESLIANLVMPEGPFAPGASVTIQGSGFTSADEIWFRAQTKADGDIQATVTHQAANELTFTVPQVPAGEHAVVLKRGTQEMPLGKLTVSEAATKLYGFGGTNDSGSYILWEVDKATGELNEIVKLPDADNEIWDSPVVNPADRNIYICKWTELGDYMENTMQLDLYRINPTTKTLELVGELRDAKEQEKEYFSYSLYVIENKLHAMIEKYSNDEDNEESFYSLVSIDTETAEQTLVADFGSLNEALSLPASTSVSIEIGTDEEVGLCYDPASKSSMWITNLVKLDIANQKIIAGERFNEYVNLFSKDGQVCGAFYNETTNSVNFRPIDTEKLTVGNSLGNITLPAADDFDDFWCYDASTGKAFGQFWKDSGTENEHFVFGAFDFNARQCIEIKEYAPGIWFDLFQ
ncbi:IPT/TIG domain-containing protein [uncultured Rikenella sp.]|uniref:IPT/TIG domain-containing protein n=1 Tax=uncultured Rikenella sp. TaxID=368003 RepID=UPI0025EC70C3|nr:IPT/TIG domain-containing protein [uncultured Rikenella sp.]